jgi:hypothetical protein
MQRLCPVLVAAETCSERGGRSRRGDQRRAASAPSAMAAALSMLDPVRLASCAIDLESTASDAAERSWPVTLMRSGTALPRKNL